MQRQAVRRDQQKLLKWLGIAVVVIFFMALIQSQTTEVLSLLGFVCITFAALLPAYMWCTGRVFGMPIFPIFAALFVSTDALPLISDSFFVREYSAQAHFFAGTTVAMMLLLATAVWANFAGSFIKPPVRVRLFDITKGEPAFWFFMVLGIVFNLADQYLWFFGGGLRASLQGFALGMSALATFVLASRMGSGKWGNSKKFAFIFLLIANIIISSSGLILIDSITRFGLAVIGYVVSSRKIPLIPIALGLVFFSLLHYGKGDMRTRYWSSEGRSSISLSQYPQWYAEWTEVSITQLQRTLTNTDSQEGDGVQSPLTRSGEIHMLLMVQDRTPQTIPYLYGTTYSLIPSLLVPRILNPDKLPAHEGTTLLNMHYGLQTREDAALTTIHVGLTAESYANFGLPGCVGLGLLLGLLFGVITRLSMNVPLTSARSLAAIVLLSVAISTQASMGIFVSSLTQAMLAMLVVALVFMKPQKTKDIFA